MTYFLRKSIQRILKFCAKIYLWRVKPRVIVIAGTCNRHWIKEGVLEELKNKKLSARGNKKNFNAEIGLPLSILGLSPHQEGETRTERWIKIILKAFLIAFYGDKKTKFLVLEMAIDKPDDMAYLLSIIKPMAAIFTNITLIYPENFSNLDEIAHEYKKLIKTLPKNGLAILNADDERILEFQEKAACNVVTYGIENSRADFFGADITKVISGQEFKIKTPDMESKTAKINRFGSHHVYAELVKNIIMNEINIK